MLVRFWGVRGSTPTPQPENMRYGGNTACVEVRVGDSLYVFDCGTGFRNLGKALIGQNRPIDAHIFISHFHWDHIQGIPFFTPLYESRDSRFIFYSSTRSGRLSLRDVLEDQMTAPYFPVDMNQMAARREFSELQAGQETQIALDGPCRAKAMLLNHPQGCLGFRLESPEGVLVYATDNEPGQEHFDKQVRRLADGADILIYDAQYLPDEYAAKRRGWGHSHWREAVDVVMQSGARELVLFHHDPDHDDACIDAIVRAARDYYPKVRAAAEGMEIVLCSQPANVK